MIEDGLANLAGAQARLGLILLRIEQAQERSGLVELIGPAIEDLRLVEADTCKATQALGMVWKIIGWD